MTTTIKATRYPARRVTSTWTVSPAWLPVPGMGVLPVNSFVLKGSEPVLVDTGPAALGEMYMESLADESACSSRARYSKPMVTDSCRCARPTTTHRKPLDSSTKRRHGAALNTTT